MFPVIKAYAIHPKVFPSMNAHGVGFKLPKLPIFTADLRDVMGAPKAIVEIITPMIGQTCVFTISSIDASVMVDCRPEYNERLTEQMSKETETREIGDVKKEET